jgi:glycosyltransferase involved in cell wall biosynthesis
MRILNIMQCADLGGMEKDGLLGMGALQEHGHSCRLVSLNPVGRLGSLLAEKHIPAVGLPYRGRHGWRSMAEMYRAFRSAPADALIMRGHNFAAMLALRDLCRDRRVLCMHHYHTGARPRWQWKTIYRLARRQFRAVTYPSDFIRREAEEIYPPIAAITHTVPNPILVPDLPSAGERIEARERLGFPANARIIGSAGWLVESKRVDVFLRVAREVALREPDALFVIAGDGPLRSKLGELATVLGIADRVRWLGWQLNLKNFFSALDVLHFNSDWEALGMTPLEGIVHGVPVVASVVHGGLGEVVKAEKHIFLASTHDIDWLTERILFVLGCPETARKMAREGRQHLGQLMSIERYVTTMERLLRV